MWLPHALGWCYSNSKSNMKYEYFRLWNQIKVTCNTNVLIIYYIHTTPCTEMANGLYSLGFSDLL